MVYQDATSSRAKKQPYAFNKVQLTASAFEDKSLGLSAKFIYRINNQCMHRKSVSKNPANLKGWGLVTREQ